MENTIFMNKFNNQSLAIGFCGARALGAGCFVDDPSFENLAQCTEETPWGSCIDINGADWALIGTWQLQSQVVSMPDGTVTNPAFGRTTKFEIGTFTVTDDLGNPTSEEVDLTFTEDYSTEQFPGNEDCTVSGGFGGGWNVTSDINLDFDPADPSTGSATIYNLKITTDPTNPQVDCEGDGGLLVRSNAATTPLGVGPGSHPVSGGFAQLNYTYTVFGTTLIIVAKEGTITNTYTYQRVP